MTGLPELAQHGHAPLKSGRGTPRIAEWKQKSDWAPTARTVCRPRTVRRLTQGPPGGTRS